VVHSACCCYLSAMRKGNHPLHSVFDDGDRVGGTEISQPAKKSLPFGCE
jgi:hypothetical protein